MDSLDSAQRAVGSDRPPLPRARVSRWLMRPTLIAGRGNRVEGSGLGAHLVRIATVFVGASADNRVTVGRNFRTKGLFVAVTRQATESRSATT